MPLVFVHGVATRIGEGYDDGVRTRNALFHRYLLRNHVREDGAPVAIYNPPWGEHGGKLRWKGASLPSEGGFETLGSSDPAVAALHVAALPEGRVATEDAAILQVARDRSLPAAVDLMWGASALEVERVGDDAAAKEVAALAKPAFDYAEANPHPPWLAEVDDDDHLIACLAEEVEGFERSRAVQPSVDDWESLGIGTAWHWIKRGAGRIARGIADAVGREASERIRPALLPPVVNFIGDVFAYLHQQQDAAGKIRNMVAGSIIRAAEESTSSDPLCVVAHSMGGNIVYDLLSDELASVRIPLLVTAGTQIGLFEELKLFRASDENVPGGDLKNRVARPLNVDRWVNIFDYSDFLGFEVGSIIEGVEDFAYATGALLKSHSQYFVQPSFHQRLVEKIDRSPGEGP